MKAVVEQLREMVGILGAHGRQARIRIKANFALLLLRISSVFRNHAIVGSWVDSRPGVGGGALVAGVCIRCDYE